MVFNQYTFNKLLIIQVFVDTVWLSDLLSKMLCMEETFLQKKGRKVLEIVLQDLNLKGNPLLKTVFGVLNKCADHKPFSPFIPCLPFSALLN